MSGKAISVEEFVEKKAKMRVIDVRATSAFSNDVSQLPGSENVPLHNGFLHMLSYCTIDECRCNSC